jgi:hypothetical protein
MKWNGIEWWPRECPSETSKSFETVTHHDAHNDTKFNKNGSKYTDLCSRSRIIVESSSRRR